jgi:hypothetical protein
MTARSPLLLSAAMCLALTAVACDKLGGGSKDSAEGAATTTAAPAGDTAPQQLADGEVASYPNMTAASGTRVVNQGFVVYQAADRSSKQLGNISNGTWVNLKGTLGNWILVEWPCGVGKLCPGWLEATVNDRRMTPDAGLGVPDSGVTPPVVPDAAAPVTPDAAPPPPSDGGTRLRIPVKGN